MPKRLQMWRCKECRRPAQIGVEGADVAECRLGIGMAEVLLNRHERHAGLVEPSGIGAAQIVGAGGHDLAIDDERIAVEYVLHGPDRECGTSYRFCPLIEAPKDRTGADASMGHPGVNVLQAPAQVSVGHQPLLCAFAAADMDGPLAAEGLAQSYQYVEAGLGQQG